MLYHLFTATESPPERLWLNHVLLLKIFIPPDHLQMGIPALSLLSNLLIRTSKWNVKPVWWPQLQIITAQCREKVRLKADRSAGANYWYPLGFIPAAHGHFLMHSWTLLYPLLYKGIFPASPPPLDSSIPPHTRNTFPDQKNGFGWSPPLLDPSPPEAERMMSLCSICRSKGGIFQRNVWPPWKTLGGLHPLCFFSGW